MLGYGAWIRHNAPVVCTEIIEIHDSGLAYQGIGNQDGIGNNGHALVAHQGSHCGAVVYTGQGGNAVDFLRLFYFKQAGQFFFRCSVYFFLTSVCNQFCKLLYNRAAKAVSYHIDFGVISWGSPVCNQALFIGPSVSGMAVSLGMHFTVVYGSADQLGPQFTATVPGRGNRAKGRLVHFIPFFPNMLNHVLGRGGAEVREKFACLVCLTPAT